MRKFKVGDRVKYTSGYYGDGPMNPLWDGKHGRIEGTVDDTGYEYSGRCHIGVTWDNGNHNGYRHDDLELIRSHCIVPEDLFQI